MNFHFVMAGIWLVIGGVALVLKADRSIVWDCIILSTIWLAANGK